MKIFKKYSILISLTLLVIGAICSYITNTYDISSKTISVIVDNNITSQVIYSLNNKNLFLNILSILMINIGIALFISSFFIKYIEQDEKEKFYDKLKLFQKDTAKDAIYSLFNRIIDNEFFAIIKKDVLNVKLIRKNAQWQYDITIEDNKPVLKRTISYQLHNISNEIAQETIKIASFNQVHSDLEVLSVKIIYSNNNEKSLKFLDNKDSTNNLKKVKEVLELQPNESIEVVIVFQQTFHNNYIYESHFSIHPIIGLEITVNYPTDYTFDLNANFSTEPNIRINNEHGKTIYVVTGAIYKGQGVEFTCIKNENQEVTNIEELQEG